MRTYAEREEKFDVDQDWSMPELSALVPDGGSLVRGVRDLDSTYFDTVDAGLRVFGVTLRRRIGGSEAGWQLKVPHGTSRTELQSGSRSKSVPKALAEAAKGLLAGDSVAPVATVVTTRKTYRIVDGDGRLVMEIADDAVHSVPADSELPVRRWRQVEVEPGPAGTEKSLKKSGKLLRDAGAESSASRNKLDQALGGPPVSRDQSGIRAGSGSVGELVGSYLAEQCQVLASNDVALRTEVNVVHRTRVAARRLRSTLRVFDDVFDASAAGELDEELVWYADLLGQVRDRDVLGSRLADLFAALPSEQVHDQIEDEIRATLHHERDSAYQRLRVGMDAERYQRLVRLLRGWRTAPPFTDAASSDRAKVLTYVDQARRQADKRLRKAGDSVDKLHRARKSMKRLRYAAELAGPADSTLSDMVRNAEHLQTVLGNHQDTIVAADFFTKAAAATTSTGSAFTYGVLVAHELAAAASIRAELNREAA